MSVLLIQPAIQYPDDHIAGRHPTVRNKEAYIEVGLLSIASYLASKGVEVMILDMSAPAASIDDLRSALESQHPCLVAIACMSGYAYPSLRDLSALVKQICPDAFVISGGQHSSPLAELVLEEIPSVDCVVRFEGEVLTWRIYGQITGGGALDQIPGIVYRDSTGIVRTQGNVPLPRLDELSSLDYRLFPNFMSFVPRLEESRGCPYDCWFCSNASVFTRKVRYKSADRLIGELCSIHEQYGSPAELNFYLIAKTYGLNEGITVEFARRAAALPFTAQWRTQSRADVINPKVIPTLSECGLRILDLGLETASPKMLKLMNKTTDPVAYLDRAAEIIETVAELPGTLLKLNLLFHPGETLDTLGESLEFLFRWRSKINAVTVSPVMVDPGAPLWHQIEYFERQFGTQLIRNEFWDSIHIYPAHPSAELSFDECNTLATFVSKMFQNKEAYFLTRRFGGLKPGTDEAQFDQMMTDVPARLLPYSIDSE